jgi:lysophospholipase L1-like esterase
MTLSITTGKIFCYYYQTFIMGDIELIGSNTRKLLVAIAIFALLANLSFFIPEATASTPAKIMPLGDSITTGYPGLEGYRRSLFLSLSNSGFSADFVGSQKNGTGFDNDNEGHLGNNTNEIRDNVIGWLNSNPADIVLLHIGTNDIQDGQNEAAVVAEVAATLDNINQWESDHSQSVTVILARIILRCDNPSWNATTKVYNNLLQTMAQTRIASGDKIVIVNMETALNYSTDMTSDGVHPNFAGYVKMAGVWYNALAQTLGYSLAVNYVGQGV